MNKVLLIRYSEIYLKGLNRPFFERALLNAITEAFKGEKDISIYKTQGRIYLDGYTDEAAAIDKVSRIFGVHSVSPALKIPKDMNIIKAAVGDMLESANLTQGSFKVFARRADKHFPLISQQICAETGGYLLNRFPKLSVDVHNPEIRAEIEVREDAAYIYCTEIMGAGGMPIKTNGKALLLLSGGIDSPVAGYMIAKRGVELECIHFFSYPYTSDRAKEKVIQLCRQLSRYCGPIRMNIIPFTELQELIARDAPPSQVTIITRRYMMLISELVAAEGECRALITGESIGQVASQTMDSLFVTDATVNMPVFRPLIGMDKSEIIDYAKKIGTFETSILPYEDCCTVFTPKHPVTHPKLEKILASESKLDTSALVQKAFDERQVFMVDESEEKF